MFKNMTLGSKLILGFLTIAALVAVVSLFAFFELSKVQGPLTREIPKGLAEIEKTSHLDGLAQKIRYLDQVLTESARNYAASGDKKWKYRYKSTEPMLDSIIREAILQGDEEDKRIFQNIQKAKLAFVEQDYQALNAMDMNDKPRALSVLESADYWQLKEEYKTGLEQYVERRGKKYGDTLEVTSTEVKNVVKKAHEMVVESTHTLSIISVFAIVLALILGLYVSRSILNPIKTLEHGVEIIGKGNLNHKIKVKSKDEIGQFADAFNEMTRKLKESYSGLEDKIREKTGELAHKVVEIEKQNLALEDAKQAIEKEKVEYAALLASIGDGMVATDQNGRIIMINQQAGHLLGWAPEEAVGQSFTELVPCEDEKGNSIAFPQRPLPVALATGRRFTTTAYYVTRDKKKFPVAITVSPIMLGDKTIGAIEIIRDITKEKEVDRMKTEFISTVSHELRTPLTVIREGVSLVIDGVLGDTNEKQQKFLGLALGDIDRLKRIIDNLLDISRIESGKVEIKKEYGNLGKLAEGVIATFQGHAQAKGLELRGHFPVKITGSYIDRDKMIQVFTNLVGNALKFTEQGFIEVGVEEKEEDLECYVRDTGRGISEEDLPRVFGKFQQFGRTHGAGEKGTGLGLSIAKGIVEMHQGKIWVESHLNEGTKFVFRLPKITGFQLFKEQIAGYLRDPSQQRGALSVFTYRLEDPERLRKTLGDEKFDVLMNDLEKTLRQCLRQRVDSTYLDRDTIFALLPGTNRENASSIARRIENSLQDCLSKEELLYAVKLSSKMAVYPEDGSTDTELLSKAA